jgi:hypothetical protein
MCHEICHKEYIIPVGMRVIITRCITPRLFGGMTESEKTHAANPFAEGQRDAHEKTAGMGTRVREKRHVSEKAGPVI